MTNKIYIVAGERNMELAALRGGGLYVNVGQTTRDVEDRLRDDDYKRKAAGGKWKVIFQQDVGVLTDKDIHPILKKHPRIYWDPDSNNTEEFLFVDDPGDGSVAKKTVIEILTPYCQSLLKKENENLRDRISALEEEVGAFSSLFGSQGIELQKIQEIEQENERLKDSLSASNKLLAVEKDESAALKGYLQRYENKLKGELRSLQDALLNTKNAAENDARWSLLKGAIAGAAVVSIVSWFCWPQSSNEVPTCAPAAPAVAQVAPAAPEPITAPPAPETKNPFHPYSSYEEWLAAGAPALQAKKKTSKPKTSKPKTAEAEATLATAPRPTQDAPTLRPCPAPCEPLVVHSGETVEAKADLFLKFETCIYGQANSNSDTISDIMKCNNGNELEMKKCLVVAAYGSSWANLQEASACWKKTH